MPWQNPPVADFDDDDTPYAWPAWRLGLKEEALFGDLHERFNTAPMFILDPDSFHADVNELARNASDKQDFYARLQERKDQRLSELKEMQEYLACFRYTGHLHFKDDNQSWRFFRMGRFASLDCLISLLASFLGPNEKGQMPNIEQFMSKDSKNSLRRNILSSGPIEPDASKGINTILQRRDSSSSDEHDRDSSSHEEPETPDESFTDYDEETPASPQKRKRTANDNTHDTREKRQRAAEEDTSVQCRDSQNRHPGFPTTAPRTSAHHSAKPRLSTAVQSAGSTKHAALQSSSTGKRKQDDGEHQTARKRRGATAKPSVDTSDDDATASKSREKSYSKRGDRPIMTSGRPGLRSSARIANTSSKNLGDSKVDAG